MPSSPSTRTHTHWYPIEDCLVDALNVTHLLVSEVTAEDLVDYVVNYMNWSKEPNGVCPYSTDELNAGIARLLGNGCFTTRTISYLETK